MCAKTSTHLGTNRFINFFLVLYIWRYKYQQYLVLGGAIFHHFSFSTVTKFSFSFPLITKNVKLLLKYKNLKTRLVKVKAKNFEYVAIMSNI